MTSIEQSIIIHCPVDHSGPSCRMWKTRRAGIGACWQPARLLQGLLTWNRQSKRSASYSGGNERGTTA